MCIGGILLLERLLLKTSKAFEDFEDVIDEQSICMLPRLTRVIAASGARVMFESE